MTFSIACVVPLGSKDVSQGNICESSRVGILKVRAGRRNLLQTLLLCSGGEGLPFQLEKLTSIRAHEDLAGREENTWWLRHGVQQRPENKKKARYLLGESMGGATVLLLHRKEPSYWNGAVLVAPMCKIADELKPHPFVVSILRKLSYIIPTWKIVPTQDIIDIAFKTPEKRQEVAKLMPKCTTRHLFLRLSYNTFFCFVCLFESKQICCVQVSLPFLVLHGGDDIVTDPSISKLLYETASSEDKTFKLYPGMWHALTSGEPPENINLVFSDIIAWLDQRTATRDPTSEMELKAKHDEDAHSKTSQIHG
ncbi:hypothetical protein BHM03_00026733 [Ensete ventricosum]|nr:hypothetical protein BHM03_00026733 [Ensete ventricosum]